MNHLPADLLWDEDPLPVPASAIGPPAPRVVHTAPTRSGAAWDGVVFTDMRRDPVSGRALRQMARSRRAEKER